MRQRKRIILSCTAFVWVVLLHACSSTKELIVLLPEEDGKVGAVAIEEPQRTTILGTPLAAARINTRGRVKQDTVTEEAVKPILGLVQPLPPKSIKFTLYFFENSMQIMPDSQAELAALLAEVAKRQAVEVQITGHTDTVGKIDDNDRLSRDRANAVKEMLENNGLHTTFIRPVGRGERELRILTPDETREPKNRRVEVIIR